MRMLLPTGKNKMQQKSFVEMARCSGSYHHNTHKKNYQLGQGALNE